MRQVNCGLYVAINGTGDVYVGMSNDLSRREIEHERNGRVTISQHILHDVDCLDIGIKERNLIHFYEIQSLDGESFDIVNSVKRMKKKEIQKRFPESDI